ncbi:hypothetical protein IE53DRAFT_225109 [Violaceomyces palustris]|uniref:Uncharacterized protein n=1 Tax=Violaceomyces palustris TaxID=1673888 RepID=A0ACD0NQ10_9BASI|nr:hypothetical protein IE53DRAFT_225109 [Violaceomyces palustris]
MVAEAAQRVLEAARRAARGQPMPDNWEPPRREGLPLLSEAVPNGEALGKAAKAEASSSSRPSPKASPSQLPLTKSSNSLSPQPLSAKPNRYSFLGLGSSTEKSSKKPKSRRPSETAPEPAAPPSDSADASTVGRRRRFVDTRELDLLASELAAQALLGGMPQPPFAFSGQSGASSPRSIGRSPLADPRRGSYYSTASGRDTPHNLSQTSLASNAMLNAMAGMPIPGRSRDASFASPGSSLPGSPPMLTHEMPRVESFNQTARSSPSTSFTHPATSLVPHDMLTGLGDGPYPAMPRRRDPLDGLDGLDPFGIPILSESPFDATAAYASRTNMHHSPVQIAPSRSRVGSSGASSMGGKRSVLSMTMHDPEAELQGLTKPPKSKRNTPFGSRANSRAVTPSTSSSALREKARNSNQEPPLSKRPSPDVAALSQIEKRAGHIPNAPTKGAEVDKAEVGAEVASAQHGVGAPQASAGGETAARPLSSANGSKNTESSATVKSEEQKSKQSQDQASSLSPPKSNQKKRLSIFGRSKEKDGGKRVKVTAASATTDRKVLSMNDLGSQKGNSVNEGESPSRKVTAQDLSGKEAVAEPRGGSNETSNVLAVVPNIQQYQEDQLPVAPSPKPVVSKAGHSVDETVKKLPEDKATEASPSCPNEADSKQKATSPPGTVQDGIKPSFIASTNAETRSLDVALTKGSRAPRAPSSHGLEPPQITSISNKKSDAASSTSARKNGGTLKKFMRRLSIFGSSKSQKPPTPPIPTMPMLAKEVGAAQPSSDSGRLKASEHDTAAHGKAASSPPGAKEAITSLSPASQSSSRLTPSSDTTTNAVGQASLFTVKTDSGLPEASRNDEESGPQLADSNQGGTYVHPDMAQNGFGTRSAKHSIEPPSLRESNADSVEDSRKISTPSTASLLMVRPASADRSDSGLSAGGETKRSDLTPSLEEDGLSPHSTETSADGTASTRSIDTGVISSSADNKSEIHVVDMATGKERGPISQAKVYSLPAVPSTATVV